jgi:glyoxylase-like metal-dependent hydrolase (beta-lactamase superfamily II)
MPLFVGTPAFPQQDFSAIEIQTVPVQGNVYLLFGAGGNSTVQAGSEGLLIVDTQFAPLADRLHAAASKLTEGALRYVINTHMHGDHVGGNSRLRQIAPGTDEEPFQMIAHLNSLTRLVQLERDEPQLVPPGALPLASFDTQTHDFFFNGEGVMIYHMPNAHTDGDVIVHFRRSDVIATGDVFVTSGYPFIDIERGGSVQGLIAALNHILHLTIPALNQEGGTMVVPGHGRLSDEADVVEFRDMVAIITERIQKMIDRGMSLREIQRERPTRDYDPEYVTENSFVSAESFVEAIFRSLADN